MRARWKFIYFGPLHRHHQDFFLSHVLWFPGSQVSVNINRDLNFGLCYPSNAMSEQLPRIRHEIMIFGNIFGICQIIEAFGFTSNYFAVC